MRASWQSTRSKRVFDLVTALIIVILAMPVILVIALCVVLDSGAPVFYRARRVGQDGRPLTILKFRKMHHGAVGGPLTIADDERFTRIGRWLARTKLDELPQLFNVIQGRMSLIGPRPEDPRFVGRHADAFRVVLRARPGLTGLGQLAFRDESGILDFADPVEDYEQRLLPQKLALDRLYVERSNVGLDFRILAWTALTLLIGVPVAVDRRDGRLTARLRRAHAVGPSDYGPATVLPEPLIAGIAPAASGLSSADVLEEGTRG